MGTAAMMQQPLATQRASFPRTPDTHDYANRSYVTTEVPECMVGMKCIRTANDDKTAEATDLGFLCFHVDMRAVVNVLYDSRATSLPDWLASVFTDRHVQALITTDTAMDEGFEVCCSDVDAGQVCMRKHLGDTCHL